MELIGSIAVILIPIAASIFIFFTQLPVEAVEKDELELTAEPPTCVGEDPESSAGSIKFPNDPDGGHSSTQKIPYSLAA